MDKLTHQIKILNSIYQDMKRNFDILEKLFKKNSTINQKIVLAEQMTNEIYKSIYNKIESDTINDQFTDIVRGIKNEKHKRSR